MSGSVEVPVLIAGGGPVGLSLALDLSWRGVPCLLVERGDGGVERPRANVVAARSMEHFRRLGLAEQIRDAGLPDDYPPEVSVRTRFLGYELTRAPWPSRNQLRAHGHDEHQWPTPELPHRVNQMFLHPVLLDRLMADPLVEVALETQLTHFEPTEDGVRAELLGKDGVRRHVFCSYLVAGDGARSGVRKHLEIALEGIDAINEMVSIYFDSAELARLNTAPAWSYSFYNGSSRHSTIFSIDGRTRWLNHHTFPPGSDTSQVNPHELVEISIGRAIQLKLRSVIRWTARALVAKHFRADRVLLVGDAAHIWIPMAGFGMNSGIQEAMELGWMLAAIHHGWGGKRLLEAYELERKPIGQQVAAHAATIARDLKSDGDRRRRVDAVLPYIEADGAAGERARRVVADFATQADLPQHAPVGLNFGYSYQDSPLIEYDGTPVPEFSLRTFEPDARPGARLPHFRRANGAPIYDELGRDFTLLRVGTDAPDPSPILAAADAYRVPVHTLAIDEPVAAELYRARLVLVRPDQHVAWRGDTLPDDPNMLMARVSGN